MKKQTNLHSIKLLSLAMVVAITIIIVAAFPASAQDKPKYKVGDRIEGQSSGTWYKAEILEAKDGVQNSLAATASLLKGRNR